MRTLNLRVLALLFVAGLAVAGATHVVHGFQVQRNANTLLREARRAQEADRSWDAVDYLRRYLALVPADTDAMAELGLLLADLNARGQALQSLEQVLRREPDRMEVRRRLVELAIEIRRYADARNHLEEHLLKSSPNDGELLDLLGQCQAAEGYDEQAVLSFRSAIEYVPDQLESYARLAVVLETRLERSDQAAAVMDRMIDANPKAVRAYVLRGNFRTRRGSIAKASEDAVVALQIAPDDAEVLLLAAQCARADQRFDEARDYLRRGLELHPRELRMHMTLAEVELRSGHRDDAIACLRRGLEALPNHTDLLWNLADLLVEEGEPAAVEELINELRAAEHPEAPLRYLEARILYERDQWFEASNALAGIRSGLTVWPDLAKQADFLLGKCYEQLGNADLQLASFRRAINVDPTWMQARAGLAAALLSMGRIDQSLEELRQLLALGSAPAAAWTQLAQLMILRNLRRTPSERDWQGVAESLDQAARATPDSVHVPILRAEVLVAQGQLEAAEESLVAAHDAQPEAVELWVALAALAQRAQDWERAAELLDETEKRLGDSAELRLARATYLVRHLGEDASAPLIRLATNTEDFPDDEQQRLYRRLASLSLQLGDFEQAERLCRLVAEEELNDLRIRLLLFDLALRSGNDESLQGLLQDVRRIEGSGPLWRYGEATRLIMLAQRGEGDGLDKARAHLTEARVARPAWSRIPLLASKIDELENDEEAAIENYLRTIELGERNPRAVQRVVSLLYQRRRYVEADQVIRRVEQQNRPFSTELDQLASRVSLQIEDFGRALELAQKAASSSQHYSDHIWLGQVLGVLGRLEEAEQALRHAVERGDDVPDTWIALIQFLGRSEQTEEAESAMAEAERKIPPGEAPLALAQCYEAIGQPERAVTKYEEALASAPNDMVVGRRVADFYLRTGRPKRAEPLLSRIVSEQLQVEESDVIWARRNLAVVFAARGGYPQFQRALKLIEQNLESDDTSVKDQRAKAIVLATRAQRRPRRSAIVILKEILDSGESSSAADRWILARLYQAEGDWADYSRQMRTLLAAHADKPLYVAGYVQSLLRRNEVQEAELWLERLVDIAPNGWSTASLKAHILMARELPNEALAAVKEFVENPDAEPSDLTQRLRIASSTLEQFAASAEDSDQAALRLAREAEAFYRRYAERSSDGILALAAFLGRSGRIDEAIDTLERGGETDRAEAVIAAIVAIRGGTETTPQHVKRIEKVIKAALQRSSRSTALLVSVADLRNLQGRYKEAETLYREIIQKEPGHVVALNNLALLLALQSRLAKEALPLMNRAVELAGPVAMLLDSRATVYMALGQHTSALADLKQAIDDAPTGTRYFHLAQAHHLVEQPEAAARALRKAHELGLAAERLHPLERAAYHDLAVTLKVIKPGS